MNMVPDTPLTYATVLSLLEGKNDTGVEIENEQRRWSDRTRISSHHQTLQKHALWPSDYGDVWERPLLRIWDKWSGSQPSRNDRMLARDKRGSLNTFDLRRVSLLQHASYKVREPTPYISFTNSANRAQAIAEFRKAGGQQGQRKPRPGQCLTVVDPRSSFRLGLPVLKYKDEMHYYGLQDPYRRDFSHYEDEYLCLWEVTPEEVVGTWEWDELIKKKDWYGEVVQPALLKHRAGEPRRSPGVPRSLAKPIVQKVKVKFYNEEESDSAGNEEREVVVVDRGEVGLSDGHGPTDEAKHDLDGAADELADMLGAMELLGPKKLD